MSARRAIALVVALMLAPVTARARTTSTAFATGVIDGATVRYRLTLVVGELVENLGAVDSTSEPSGLKWRWADTIAARSSNDAPRWIRACSATA